MPFIIHSQAQLTIWIRIWAQNVRVILYNVQCTYVIYFDVGLYADPCNAARYSDYSGRLNKRTNLCTESKLKIDESVFRWAIIAHRESCEHGLALMGGWQEGHQNWSSKCTNYMVFVAGQRITEFVLCQSFSDQLRQIWCPEVRTQLTETKSILSHINCVPNTNPKRSIYVFIIISHILSVFINVLLCTRWRLA